MILMDKRLYRSSENRLIAGVCGGISEYFDVDPTIIRIISVLVCLFGGAGILAYVVAIIIIPKREGGTIHSSCSDAEPGIDKESPKNPDNVSRNNTSSNILGVILVILGLFFFARQFFHINFLTMLAIIFVVSGILIIIKGRRF
jgi:phage shock protein C